MQIVEYHAKYLPSLTQLINQEIAALPPGFVLSEEQVEQSIAQGIALWRLHYPDHRTEFHTATLCVLEHSRVVAAAQWVIPKKDARQLSLLWLVAEPKRPVPLRTLLHLIDKQAQLNGCRGIDVGRFSFGAGWFGIPADWKHVIHAMREAGYKRTNTWLLMRGSAEGHNSVAPPQIEQLRYHWNMNKPALEWELYAYQDETLAGACQVWGIPPHLETCSGVSHWTTLEWIEVERAYRRHGVARWLMAEQMRFHARRGVTRFIVWVGQRNRAARALHESMGFTYGPKLAIMEKSTADEAAQSG